MTHKNKKIAIIATAVIIAGGGAYLYHRHKMKLLPVSSGPTKNSAPSRYVVGGYDPANNRTYIFQEGNTGNGFFVTGHVNSIKGTIFTLA